MEVKKSSAAWLDKSHPNYERWERARKLSVARGNFVKSIIEKHSLIQNKKILDLGSGEGGTASVFADASFAVSYDISAIRLLRQKNSFPKNILLCGNGVVLPFKSGSFNIVIIQDVIEHITQTDTFIAEVKRVLKNDGIIYLSTPNKNSIFNFLADPHWGVPVVSILKRKTIIKYFLKNFRKNELDRKDIPQLFSLKNILRLFDEEFDHSLNTVFSVKELFNGNQGIIWSNYHLGLVSSCRKVKLDKLLLALANDKIGILNKYFTPTFYLIFSKQVNKNLK